MFLYHIPTVIKEARGVKVGPLVGWLPHANGAENAAVEAIVRVMQRLRACHWALRDHAEQAVVAVPRVGVAVPQVEVAVGIVTDGLAHPGDGGVLVGVVRRVESGGTAEGGDAGAVAVAGLVIDIGVTESGAVGGSGDLSERVIAEGSVYWRNSGASRLSGAAAKGIEGVGVTTERCAASEVRAAEETTVCVVGEVLGHSVLVGKGGELSGRIVGVVRKRRWPIHFHGSELAACGPGVFHGASSAVGAVPAASVEIVRGLDGEGRQGREILGIGEDLMGGIVGVLDDGAAMSDGLELAVCKIGADGGGSGGVPSLREELALGIVGVGGDVVVWGFVREELASGVIGAEVGVAIGVNFPSEAQESIVVPSGDLPFRIGERIEGAGGVVAVERDEILWTLRLGELGEAVSHIVFLGDESSVWALRRDKVSDCVIDELSAKAERGWGDGGRGATKGIIFASGDAAERVGGGNEVIAAVVAMGWLRAGPR